MCECVYADELAEILLDALKRSSDDALIAGTAGPEGVLIDGEFDLMTVASIIIDRLRDRQTLSK